jgi:4-hydroxythreonine-4-phosphate dehydrogenase
MRGSMPLPAGSNPRDADGTDDPRPLVALTVGDPAGIGPEIAVASLADPSVRSRLRVLVLGPGSLRPAQVPKHAAGSHIETAAWIETFDPLHWTLGEHQASCGKAAIAALRAGHLLASSGEVDALVTGPVGKRSLHLAGEPVEGQTELLGRWSNVSRFEMIGISGRLRVMLHHASHAPPARALESITGRCAISDARALRREPSAASGSRRPASRSRPESARG